MNEIRTLLMLEIRSLYGLNKFRYTSNPKERKRYRGLLAVWVLIVCMVLGYAGSLVYGLCFMGLGHIVPAYLAMLASVLVLVFGFFTAGNRILGLKGYDILASMPVKRSSIVTGRFLALYTEDLVLTIAVMLPGIAVYGFCLHPAPGFYVISLIGALFIPAVPMVISVLVGTLIMAVSSRMKNKSLMQSVLMVIFVLAVFLGSVNTGHTAENFTVEQFCQLAQTLGNVLERIYPPAVWFGNAAIRSDGGMLSLFALFSMVVMLLAIGIVNYHFKEIIHRLQSFTARHNYSIGTMESSSLLKALYVRELKRYFSSSIYVTNTIIGPILGTVMSVALCVAGTETIQRALPGGIEISEMLPFAFAGVFCMMTTTSVSVSMEGKEVWIVKSLPVPVKALLDSKILLNLTLMLPCFLISVIAMIIAVEPDLLEIIWMLLIPAAIMLFSVVFGITVNLKFHSFDWEKEETIVKQSLSAMLGGFAGLLMAAIFGAIALLVPVQYGDTIKVLFCMCLVLLTVFLYRRNNTTVISTW